MQASQHQTECFARSPKRSESKLFDDTKGTVQRSPRKVHCADSIAGSVVGTSQRSQGFFGRRGIFNWRLGTFNSSLQDAPRSELNVGETSTKRFFRVSRWKLAVTLVHVSYLGRGPVGGTGGKGVGGVARRVQCSRKGSTGLAEFAALTRACTGNYLIKGESYPSYDLSYR